jgi:hypothetical protein
MMSEAEKYGKECPICHRDIQDNNLMGPIPPHKDPRNPQMECLGSGGQGKVIPQR